jgi:hypothetical protein
MIPPPCPAEVEKEITDALGPCSVEPFSHPWQRNRTFLVRCGRLQAIAKLYADLGLVDLQDIGRAEVFVSNAGVGVAPLLFQSATIPLVIHERLPGVHRQPVTNRDVEHAADWFQVQLAALRSLGPARLVQRPSRPPERARRAGARAQDPAVRDLIRTTWQRLSELADRTVPTVSHTDWRTDNLLYRHDRLSAVLDWESIVELPAGEAAGYAAASFTHSWRPNLYRPFEIETTSAFMRALRKRMPLLDEDLSGRQFRVATAFTAAVRLGEDQVRGMAASTREAVLAILEDGDLP